jgi:tRNA(Ile)-lysidine synthase TilS/MesJ
MEKKDKNAEARFKKLCQKVGKTIRDHRMLEEGDHLLLGLSGGKDSYLLLETLADRKKFMPFNFLISAVHVKVQNVLYRMDTGFMEGLCEDLQIPLHLIEITPDFEQDKKKAPCFVCSWHRRKEIFNLGKELNCNKLAFGHHRDDALETFMMNLMYHGSVSSLPYSLEMFDGRVRLIRPLMDIWEKEIQEFVNLRDYPKAEKSCPYDDQTKRRQTRKLIEQMEQNYSNSKINIFHALDNMYPEYLPKSRSLKRVAKTANNPGQKVKNIVTAQDTENSDPA